jgi:hypothetical protein
MTSWTTEELEQLSDLDNHKIVRDSAGEYLWKHKLDNKWELHSIKVFEEINTPYSWLYFWIDKWSKELRERRARVARQTRRRMNRVRRSKRMTNKEKAIEIRNISDSHTVQEIANELSISKRSVERYLAD